MPYKDPFLNVQSIRVVLIKRHTNNLSAKRINSWCVCAKYGERLCSPQPIWKNTPVMRVRKSFLTRTDGETKEKTIWYRNETWRIECWETINRRLVEEVLREAGNPKPERNPGPRVRKNTGTKLQSLSPKAKQERNNLQTQLGVYKRRLAEYQSRENPSDRVGKAMLSCRARIKILTSKIEQTLVPEPEGVMSELQEQLLKKLT